MYPDHNINPIEKNAAWFVQYCKQTWADVYARTPNIFYGAAEQYELLKKYAMGKQPNTKYMKPYQDEHGKSWSQLDHTIRPVIVKYRDIALSRLMQVEHDIVATAIDQLAKDDEDKYYADAKARIIMRDLMKQANPELLESPVLKKQDGEAEDLEELEMQMGYSYKHNASLEAELTWQLVSYQSDFEEERRQSLINHYDLGPGGYKEWTDEYGKTKIRAIMPQNIVISYCHRPDFKDATHIGEVIQVNLTDLATIFTKEEMLTIEQAQRSDYAYKPTANIMRTDRAKVSVLDLELISRDGMVFMQRVDDRGNLIYGQAKFSKKDSPSKVIIDGKEQPKYKTKSVENVYRVKWVIGTDLVYDYGLMSNQKRDPKNPSKACMSFHMYAYNFYNMTAVSIMSRLMPVLDEYQATVLKIQHFKNKWIPYIIDIDMDALENVALGNAGQTMKPMELLDMIFQTQVMLSRKRDMSSGNINYKSIEVQATPMAAEFQVLLNDLARLLQEISDISGFNQLTDGSTPNAKTLVPVANMANESTNNALYPITYAEKNTKERAAKGVIQRVQLSVKNGTGVEGIVHALGTNTVKFIKVSKDLSLHDFGIMVQDRPTQEERAMLLQDLNVKNSQGLIDPGVYVMVKNTQNLKQAEMLLAHKMKKKREQEQQYALQQQQQTGQIQVQSAQAAEKAKQETLQLEYQLKGQLELQLKHIDFEIAKLKVQGAADVANISSGSQIIGQAMGHQADERLTRMDQGRPVEDQNIDPEALDMMQQQPQTQQQPMPEEQGAEMPTAPM